MPFQWLLLDVLVDILSYLEVRDILALQHTCKNIRDVTQLYVVWKNVLEKQTTPSGKSFSFPNNGSPSNLTARDLQRAVIYETRLDINWTSRDPIIFSHTSITVDAQWHSVHIAFLLPFQGGKYLLAVSGRDRETVSIWHLEPALREYRRICMWEAPGLVLNAVPNSDSQDRATIALSYTPYRKGPIYVILYNLSFTENESERPIANYKSIFDKELRGRLKILRGNLIGLSRTAQIYLFDYHNQVTINFNLWQPDPENPGCLAMEVLSDCVIAVHYRSIDIFRLPDVARGGRPGATTSFNVPLMVTIPCPPTSQWDSASIIPYCPPYPAERLSPASRPISILANEIPDAVKHYYFFHPPRINLADSDSRSVNISPTESPLHIAQVHTGVPPHYFHHVMVSPTSGRGLWVNQNSSLTGMPRERLVIFSAPHSSLVGWPLVDIAESSTVMIEKGCWGVGTAVHNVQYAVGNRLYWSFDDESGRVVGAISGGYVLVLQFGTV